MCNGKAHCPDGSDETVELCSSHYCPTYAFRCTYGGCVQGRSRCNQITDCLDGSDEAEALCGVPPPTTPSPQATQPSGSCVIPAIEGGYALLGNRTYSPNEVVPNGVQFTMACQQPTTVDPTPQYCINGILILPLLQCISNEWHLHILVIVLAKRRSDSASPSLPLPPSPPSPTTPAPPPTSTDFRGLSYTTAGQALDPGDVRR